MAPALGMTLGLGRGAEAPPRLGPLTTHVLDTATRGRIGWPKAVAAADSRRIG